MFWEYNDWSEAVKSHAFAPLLTQQALDYDFQSGQLVIYPPHEIILNDDDIYFPKLGPKSWRDARYSQGANIGSLDGGHVAKMIAQVSENQIRLLHAVASQDAPLYLYLFEWRDFRDVSEFKVAASKGSAKISSCCIRSGQLEYDLNLATGVVLKFAQTLNQYFDDESLKLDIAVTSDMQTYLIDVNPLNLSLNALGSDFQIFCEAA